MTLEQLKLEAAIRQSKKNNISNEKIIELINKSIDEGKIQQENAQVVIDSIQGIEIEIKE